MSLPAGSATAVNHAFVTQQAPEPLTLLGGGRRTGHNGREPHPGLGVTNVPPLGGCPPCPLLLVMEETKTRQSLSV